MTPQPRNKQIDRPMPGEEGVLMGMIQRAAADRHIRVLEGYMGTKQRQHPNHIARLAETHQEANAFFIDGRFQYWCDLAGWQHDAITDRLRREAGQCER